MAGKAIDYAVIEAERARIRDTFLGKGATASSARGIHHVALLSSDVERTVRFYQLIADPLGEMYGTKVL